jgi:ubiquinone/menaquinone biosynthesis C-methylase UbiE
MTILSADDVAEIYDLTNPWDPARWPADAFYTDLVMAAHDVLDVGCGTGSMLHDARRRGHTGRLVGIDPDPAMLARARRRPDVEWRLARADELDGSATFELATMTSHAFQCLVTDDDIQASLRAIRACLRGGGRFAFETRHPQARAWEQWAAAAPSVIAFNGRELGQSYRVESVAGDVVSLVEVLTDSQHGVVHEGRASLRFLEPAALNGHLAQAGLSVEAQSGDWHGGPVTASSTEIVTIARA